MAARDPPRPSFPPPTTPHKPSPANLPGAGRGSRPEPGHAGPPRGKGVLRVVLALAIVTLAAWYSLRPRVPADDGPAIVIGRGGPVELPPPRAFPEQDTLRTREGLWITQYLPDEVLQARVTRWVNQYRPEGAVVVVSDLRTGQIRVLVERDSAGTRSMPMLALGTTFPAASLAKIVTAAAAIEAGVSAHDDLPLLGGAHTLYRSQLRVPSHGRHPTVTLREAFARSINPTFGLLGLRLGPDPLRDMAERLGFDIPPLPGAADRNGFPPALLPGPFGVASIQGRLLPPDSGFGLAEVASGFTTATTISPLHAVQIARALGGDGRMLPARFTRSLLSLDNGRTLLLPEPQAAPFASQATLRHMRGLMEATVTVGTARRGFRRNLNPADFARLEMGGKTGSLTGHNPPGRYEWYVGYARRKDHPDQGIAVAVMLINRTYLAVHATELAGLVIRDWLRYSPPYPDEDGRYLAER